MLKGRVLGVDFGLKRIGLALSDPLQVIASPLENLEAKNSLKETAKALAAHIIALKKEKGEITQIVIGLPLHMDGRDSERSGLVREFSELLKAETNLPVALLDERLSSVQAERALIETGYTRKKRAQVVDRVSAVIILQTYLSRQGLTI
jgi:putative Holliday junction resolvase